MENPTVGWFMHLASRKVIPGADLLGRIALVSRVLGRIVWIMFVIIWFSLSGGMIVAFFRISGGREKAFTAAGRRFAHFAEVIGPTGIKLAQVLSYRSDLMPTEFIAPLRRVQDQVKRPSRIDPRKVLEAAFAAPLETLFRTIDESPTAAGSVAVVWRGYSLQGHQVAIKALRPGVARLIEIDLLCLRTVVRRIARFGRFNGLPLYETFEIFAVMIEAQCDMRIEAQNAVRLIGMVGREVVIPVPICHLVKRDVLVMQYLPSTKLTDPLVADALYRPACRALLRDLYRMIFVQGFVHGDLHPGNVGLADDGRVILYDFGLVASLSAHDRLLFRDFFLAVITANSTDAASHILSSAQRYPQTLDIACFTFDVNDLLKRYSGQLAGAFLVVGFVTDLFQLQRKHGVYGPPGFANAVWALAMFEGLVRDRYPGLDFQAEARAFIRPLLKMQQDMKEKLSSVKSNAMEK